MLKAKAREYALEITMHPKFLGFRGGLGIRSFYAWVAWQVPFLSEYIFNYACGYRAAPQVHFRWKRDADFRDCRG